MEGGLLSTPEFNAFTKKVVPFLHVTTKIDGRANDGLLMEKGGTGFPTLMFLDEAGEILGQPAGRDVGSFDKTLGSLMNIKNLEKRIAAGEKDLKDDLFFAELDMGKYNLSEAQAKAKEFTKLSKEQKAALAQHIVNLSVKDVIDNMGREEGALAEAAFQLLAIKQQGHLPTGEVAGGFWFVLLQYAEENSDAELFATALAELKLFYADNARAMEFLNAKDTVLEEMQNAEGVAVEVEEAEG